MIGLNDLETEAGQTEFANYQKSALRFIKSRGVKNDDAEDLSQEVGLRVLNILKKKEDFKANVGLFIEVAKRVVKEYWPDKPPGEGSSFSPEQDDSDTGEEIPEPKQLSDFEKEKERAVLNECLLECLNALSMDNQILLWRYSYDEENHWLTDEDDESQRKFFDTILDSLKETSEKFIPFLEFHQPMKKEEKKEKRLKIHRLREGLRDCKENCIARKKRL